MSDGVENALGGAASAYLRSARHQPVQWQEWGPEAFEKARVEGKPVLLDIGAVWCHWCHVMDRESYESAEIAGIINDHFVAVKVDRDERPDVDTRYQAAVAAISGQGGWPLTAFLTPDGRPYFGGTYFPPEDRYGRPGFPRVLLTMAHAFQNTRDEVDESAGSVMAAIEESENFAGAAGELGPELLSKIVESILKQFDERNGGFGSQPKFPHSGAVELLLDAAGRGRSGVIVGPGARDEWGTRLVAERAREVTRLTLRKMAEGGIHDQLAGGFHRYSVDERWVVPHFEKMAYDNSELLKNYVHGFQVLGDPELGRVARGIVRWMDEWLSDREGGGFYSSQDADVSLEDDGDYFTWTQAEARAALSGEEFAVAAEFLNIRELGDMHHNVAKNVLHVNGVPDEQQRALLEQAKRKLCGARLERKAPFVDKTMYTGWNAMCISAYLVAGRGLEMPEVKEFALRSLERVLAAAWDRSAGLAHVVAYGDGLEGARVSGVLEDYAFLGSACVDAWEATGELKFYAAAKAIADGMLGRFYDTAAGGFFDTQAVEGAIGALSARRKPLQDAPTPAGNSVAAALLLRMEALSGEAEYGTKARTTLKAFAGIVEHFGLYAASYGLALVLEMQGTAQVLVAGEDERAAQMERAGLARFAVNRSVVRLSGAEMPPGVAHLPEMDGSFALICAGRACLPPVRDADELEALLGGGTSRW